MANFTPPFGSDAAKRPPTANEKTNGFQCGPAEQRLFNGLFHRIESEIGDVISHAGLIPSDGDLTQLRQAIDAQIGVAVGNIGGNTDDFLLLSQASARLPIFPEIVSSDFRMNISSPASGTIRIPGNVQFIHRGINPITTVETDFSTDVSSTYHIRWHKTDGFVMRDLASNIYNPGTLPETDTAFDTTFDDMLIARVVTNSNNIATITNLANASDLTVEQKVAGTDAQLFGLNGANFLIQHSLNWARRVKTYSLNVIKADGNDSFDFDVNIVPKGTAPRDDPALALNVQEPDIYIDRYGLDSIIMRDYTKSITVMFVGGA